MSTPGLTSMYEALLEETSRLRGNYGSYHITPRLLVQAMVEVMRPMPGELICDPACGTGGFLAACHDYIRNNSALDGEQLYHLKHTALRGWEADQNAARLAALNLYIRGVSLAESPIRPGDALDYSSDEERHDVVIANIALRGMAPDKKPPDFWTNIPSRHLNYLHRCMALLKDNGRAAVVIPDHVLFVRGQYGGEIARRQLLELCNVHTLLRLPRGMFPGIGVKGSVLFFDRISTCGGPRTHKLWVYDMRSTQELRCEGTSVSLQDFKDFILSYSAPDRSARVESQNFRPFTYEELIECKDVNLDLSRRPP